MNTIKNAHSPAGMGYSLHGTRLRNLVDCPRCKYGTLDRYWKNDREIIRCADCGAIFTVEELQKIKSPIPPPYHRPWRIAEIRRYRCS